MSSKEIKTLVLPGAVDLHVHWREPGTNPAETIRSGSAAALMGGFLLACDMPNNPGRPTWSYDRVIEKHRLGIRSHIPFATYAGSQPESDNISELEKMAEVCIGLKGYASKTTGNKNEHQAEDFREIITEWDRVAPDKPFMLHAGRDNLEDFIGLVGRDLGHHLHVCHVNNPEDVKLVTEAKAKGLPVTCGVCPHHLFKTSRDLGTEGEFAKVQPPLAESADADQLFHMLVDGQIDNIETDHAPHTKQAKWQAEHEGGECFGFPGSEFALPLLFYQMKKGRISPERIIEATSSRPAQIIGVDLSPRTKATWAMEEYRIENEADQVYSGAGWTPYLGMLAVGKVQSASVGGKELVHDGKIVGSRPAVITRRNSGLL